MSKLLKLVVTVVLTASLGPTIASSASFFTPHDQLVQEMSNTYHTHFPTNKK